MADQKKQGYCHHGEIRGRIVVDQFTAMHLPMYAVYQFAGIENNNELSDEEGPDAMPARELLPGSQFLSKTLQNGGQIKTRPQLQIEKIQKNPETYSLKNIESLILNRQFVNAERRITVLIEAGLLVLDETNNDLKCHSMINTIEQAYSLLSDKPNDSDLRNYHRTTWYSKLKVLSGVKIPNLLAVYPFK